MSSEVQSSVGKICSAKYLGRINFVRTKIKTILLCSLIHQPTSTIRQERKTTKIEFVLIGVLPILTF